MVKAMSGDIQGANRAYDTQIRIVKVLLGVSLVAGVFGLIVGIGIRLV